MISIVLSGSNIVQTISYADLLTALQKKPPFAYDLGINIIPSSKKNAQVTICCHGYGGSNAIADVIHSYGVISDHLIGFNFPEYDLETKPYDPATSTFGSIDELLPLLYLIKMCVIDGQLTTINLYGFSAGGGAIINALAALNSSIYDERLAEIGITDEYKQKMISAIEHGSIILDCPLKSIEDIIAHRGPSDELLILAKHYAQNDMRPIDTLNRLKVLKLNIMLHFQMPDDVIGNRDDALFIDRLQKVNKGKTEVVVGNDSGHNTFHASLWDYYKKFKK